MYDTMLDDVGALYNKHVQIGRKEIVMLGSMNVLSLLLILFHFLR